MNDLVRRLIWLASAAVVVGGVGNPGVAAGQAGPASAARDGVVNTRAGFDDIAGGGGADRGFAEPGRANLASPSSRLDSLPGVPPVSAPPATIPPLTVPPVAAPPSSVPAAVDPPGLSRHVPSTPPAIGLIGGQKGGRSPSPTPEPSTLLLMGAGLAGLYRFARQRD